MIAGIFSPLDNDGRQEVYAKTIVERELGPNVNVVCSRNGMKISPASVMSIINTVILCSWSSRPSRARKCLNLERGHPQLRPPNYPRVQTRHERAQPHMPSLPHAERRHPHFRSYRRQTPHTYFRIGADELDAWRSISSWLGRVE